MRPGRNTVRVFIGPALLALAISACASKAPGVPGADEYIVNCDGADGGAVTSDEDYTKIIEADSAGTSVADACRSPLLAAPTPGTKLDPVQPPVFTFSAVHPTCGLHREQGTRFGCLQRQQGQPGWSSALESALALVVRPAEAHCAAFTGENYLFRLAHAGEAAAVYSAMLSLTSFTPDPAVWKKAMAGRQGQTLTLTIERAIFFRGDINQGPYRQPQPWSFVVGP